MTGAFGFPEGVASSPAAVVDWAILMEGRGAASVGAEALAEWIIADEPRAVQAFGDPLCPIQGRSLVRVLAGAVLPGDDWAEWLGRATGGAVEGAAFLRPAVREGVAAVAPAEPAKPVAPVEWPQWLLCEIAGPVGTTPSGPLFAAIVDPLSPSLFAVAGLGQAMVFDRSTACAFRDALADGLGQLPA